MSESVTRVMIVEDQPIERETLEHYVNASSRYRVACSIENASFAEMYCMNGGIDLILMDICTADDESGLTAAAQIKKYWPHIKIVMVTSMPECSFLDKAHAAGAESFWYKGTGCQALLALLDETMAGKGLYPDQTPELRIGDASSYDFTRRELEILRDLVEYATLQEIADHLHISVETVRTHLKHLLDKTGYPTKTKLAIAIVNKKLILPNF